MARPQQGQNEDFIKRAQMRLKSINERTEQLRNELNLPPEAKYTMASLIQADELATDVSPQVSLPNGSSLRTGRLNSLPVLAASTAIGVGVLIFGLGLAITRVSGTNTAFATPLATLATALIFACIVSSQMQHGWNALVPTGKSAYSYGKRNHYFSSLIASLPINSSVLTPYHKKETNFAQPAHSTPKTQAKKEELWKDKGVLLFVTLSLLAVSIASMFLNLISPGQGQNIGNRVVSHADIDPTGLSYGTIAFDTHRADGDLKRQAAARLAAGDTNGAIVLWNKAITLDREDAEAYIYLENTRVLLSKQPHLTLAVATLFSQGVTGLGRDDLQGAYIAQKDYNERMQRSGGMQLLLLVAVADDDLVSVTNVAQKIVQEAQHDPTMLGVMGWPTSTSALAAIKVLANAHIPLLSESATSDVLTGISPYFFRMGTDTRQASSGAKYAMDVLKVKHVAVFEDPANAYSKSLADAFINTFTSDGQHTVVKQLYTVKQAESLAGPIRDVMTQHVDMIYMSGYAPDASTLLAALPPCKSSMTCIQVMGGDALNTLGDYQPASYANFSRVHFTAFAYAGLWKEAGMKEPAFFKEYQDAFSAERQQPTSVLTAISPDADAILAFDALNTFLQGNQQLQIGSRQHFTPEELRQTLVRTNFQGVSGRITFDQNGNVVNKAVLMLHLGDDHRPHLEHSF